LPIEYYQISISTDNFFICYSGDLKMPKTKTKIIPAPGYVLIKPLKEEKTTASGIVLPDSHEEKPQTGEVVAVGGDALIGETKIKSPVKAGDKVVFKEWSGNEYKPDGTSTELMFIKFEDILGIIG
jgi:chaperonin GroES